MCACSWRKALSQTARSPDNRAAGTRMTLLPIPQVTGVSIRSLTSTATPPSNALTPMPPVCASATRLPTGEPAEQRIRSPRAPRGSQPYAWSVPRRWQARDSRAAKKRRLPRRNRRRLRLLRAGGCSDLESPPGSGCDCLCGKASQGQDRRRPEVSVPAGAAGDVVPGPAPGETKRERQIRCR